MSLQSFEREELTEGGRIAQGVVRALTKSGQELTADDGLFLRLGESYLERWTGKLEQWFNQPEKTLLLPGDWAGYQIWIAGERFYRDATRSSFGVRFDSSFIERLRQYAATLGVYYTHWSDENLIWLPETKDFFHHLEWVYHGRNN